MQSKKTVILLGPNGHLGIEILRRLLKDYYVIGISRNSKKVILKDDLRKNYYPFEHDLKIFNEESIYKFVKDFLELKKTNLHGIINNAFFGYPEIFNSINKNDVYNSAEGILGVQIRLIITLESFLKKGSSIINISSMYGKVAPNPANYTNDVNVNALLYGSMKAALIQASKWMSASLGVNGIRVNSVSFGPFPQENIQQSNPIFIENLSKQTHLKRIGKPQEAPGIILFLLSDDSSYITGSDISVDGGWTAW